MTPRSDVSEERRAQIIQAALACFSRKGYNKTTMDDIVAESGLSKGSLYWYFKSKDELFTETAMSVLTDIGQNTWSAIEQCSTASEKLRAFAQITVEFSERIKGFLGLFLEFWASSPNRDRAGQVWLGVLVQYKDLFVEIVEQGIRDGEFKPVDAEQLVWAVMAAYDGLAVYVELMPDMIDVSRASQVLMETLLSGLAVENERQGE
ncbi:MAG: TetR/AcrR family transcriptional regulator [Chloroflexota bacterium]|nr:TetR/AcrR family transcriptional regulator [Chloroflexota bacterium]